MSKKLASYRLSVLVSLCNFNETNEICVRQTEYDQKREMNADNYSRSSKQAKWPRLSI